MDGDVDTGRSVVQTYVPKYQKDEWKRHAERLDMSQSEFVRAMVQAGRRGFDGGAAVENGSGAPGAAADPENQSASVATGDVREHVLTALSGAEALDWDALIEGVTAEIEDEVEGVLEELQADNDVRYSGPKGGYTLVADR